MKIVVLVKEVPDTYGDRKLSLETGLADRAASEAVIGLAMSQAATKISTAIRPRVVQRIAQAAATRSGRA